MPFALGQFESKFMILKFTSTTADITAEYSMKNVIATQSSALVTGLKNLSGAFILIAVAGIFSTAVAKDKSA